MIRDCPAKVNLFLEVTARRDDGYHDLATVFAAIDLFDSITIKPSAPGVKLTVTGADLPSGKGNLAYDAASMFFARFAPDRGAEVTLEKRIPVQAGLGGGSSDAAGVLLALRDMFRPDVQAEALAPLALELGSDVPYFLLCPVGGAALGRGRGERISTLPPTARYPLAVFLPDFGLSTPEVYGAVEVPSPDAARNAELLIDALAGGSSLAGLMFNRLEVAAARVRPELEDLLARLRADLGPGEQAILSGSGSAVLGVARDGSRAAGIAEAWNKVDGGRAIAVSTL